MRDKMGTMQANTPDIERFRRDLRSTQVATRQVALDELRAALGRDSSIRAVAADLLRELCRGETNPWVLLNAVRGLELAADKAEVLAVKLGLIERSEADIVAMALLNLNLNLSADRLLEMYARTNEYSLRNTLVHMLARTRDARAFPILLSELDKADMRPYAIEALVAYGDSRAVEHIERCLSDTSDAWPIDNHGPMMRVCDVAREAIERLRKAR
ncbi:MAG: hypothetical protein ACKVS9_03910 [Phycisphaerae bacterium]